MVVVYDTRHCSFAFKLINSSNQMHQSWKYQHQSWKYQQHNKNKPWRLLLGLAELVFVEDLGVDSGRAKIKA